MVTTRRLGVTAHEVDVNTALPAHILTFLAEEAGDCPDDKAPRIIEELINLLKHASPTVREGAVIGLSKLIRFPQSRQVLEHHVDDSPGVRAVLADALNVY
jgi:hypothetical protein